MAPAVETVTIINNAGKIISTGRQLIDLIKEGRAIYQEKKKSLHSERSATTRTHRSSSRPTEDDSKSHQSRQSSKLKSGSHHHHRRSSPLPDAAGSVSGTSTLALTERNLRVLTVASKTGPTISVPPPAVTAALQSIDPHLAYGDMPPNLAHRYDLDPAWQAHNKERQAATIAARVETLLDEARLLHQTSTTMIAKLQAKPESAAAVALALAELSSLVAKLSPTALSSLKVAAPAAFGLLASPQFLVGAGVAVGVTVVVFGGWKIIRRLREASREAPAAIAWNAQAAISPTDVEEALVMERQLVDKELAGIEAWRSGIYPDFGDGTTAYDPVDEELISPAADRTIRRSRHDRDRDRDRDGHSVASRSSHRDWRKCDGASDQYGRSTTIHTILEETESGRGRVRDDDESGSTARRTTVSKTHHGPAVRPKKRDLLFRAILLRRGKRDCQSIKS